MLILIIMLTKLAHAQSIAHAVMIDAGSTGSRIHVFSYSTSTVAGKYATIKLPEPMMRVHPGVSAFAPSGLGVTESIERLLKFAKQQVEPPYPMP